METLEIILKAQGVCLGYEVALTQNEITFEILRNKTTALVGKNGSGKSTLLRSLLSDPPPIKGTFLFEGKDLSKFTGTDLARHFALVSQEPIYPSDLLAIDLLRQSAISSLGAFEKLPSRDDPNILSLVRSLKIEDLMQRPLKALSTGERQKVFLAYALLQKPSMLLLDEPTSHLDPGAQRDFWAALNASAKITNLVCTHDMDFVRSQCDWVLALNKGNLCYNGPVDEAPFDWFN